MKKPSETYLCFECKGDLDHQAHMNIAFRTVKDLCQECGIADAIAFDPARCPDPECDPMGTVCDKCAAYRSGFEVGRVWGGKAFVLAMAEVIHCRVWVDAGIVGSESGRIEGFRTECEQVVSMGRSVKPTYFKYLASTDAKTKLCRECSLPN